VAATGLALRSLPHAQNRSQGEQLASDAELTFTMPQLPLSRWSCCHAGNWLAAPLTTRLCRLQRQSRSNCSRSPSMSAKKCRIGLPFGCGMLKCTGMVDDATIGLNKVLGKALPERPSAAGGRGSCCALGRNFLVRPVSRLSPSLTAPKNFPYKSTT